MLSGREEASFKGCNITAVLEKADNCFPYFRVSAIWCQASLVVADISIYGMEPLETHVHQATSSQKFELSSLEQSHPFNTRTQFNTRDHTRYIDVA